MAMLPWIIASALLTPVLIFAVLAYLRYQRKPKFRRGRLEPLEQRLLAELTERSDPALAERLRRQLALLPVHCRLHFDKSLSLSLYPGEDSTQVESDDIRFPNRSDFRLATISFTAGEQKFKAQVGATGGRLFEMIIRPNPRRFLRSSVIEVTGYERAGDAMQPTAEIPRQRYDTVPAFTGILGEWSARFGLDDVCRPLEKSARSRALSRINATLPADYLELMRHTDGFIVGSWHVRGLADVRSVSLGAHEYFVLADEADFVACVREGSETGTVCLCAITGDSPIPEGASLTKVIDDALKADSDDKVDRNV
jgi:hypothetical protein